MKYQVGGEQSSCGQVLQLWATVDRGSQGKLRYTHVTKIRLGSLAPWPEIYICDTFLLCQSPGQTQVCLYMYLRLRTLCGVAAVPAACRATAGHVYFQRWLSCSSSPQQYECVLWKKAAAMWWG